MNRARRRKSAPHLIASVAFAATLGAGCGSTDDRPAVWEYLSPAIFQPNCATASCHSRATAVSGLDFSTPARGYTSLTGLRIEVVDGTGAIDGANGRPLVTRYDPGQSRLVNMLRARGAARMPPDRPLSEADVRLVEKWILAGAFDKPSAPGILDASTDDGRRPDVGVADGASSDRGAADGGVDGPGAPTDSGSGGPDASIGGDGATGTDGPSPADSADSSTLADRPPVVDTAQVGS